MATLDFISLLCYYLRMTRGREEAFAQFLGVDGPGSEFPQSFTVPQPIHERALDALSRTVQDGHERSLHFRYRKDQWRGGIAVRGTRTSASFAHVNSTIFLPPHIQLHTHPDISDEELEETVESSNMTGFDSASEAEDVLRRALQIMHQVPSSSDVFRSLHEPFGSVGHLLVSSYGIFAWVHKDVRATKGILQNTLGPRYKRHTSFARDRADYVETTDVETFRGVADMDLIRQKIMQTRSSALESAYVCYASEEPEKPELVKIGAS